MLCFLMHAIAITCPSKLPLCYKLLFGMFNRPSFASFCVLRSSQNTQCRKLILITSGINISISNITRKHSLKVTLTIFAQRAQQITIYSNNLGGSVV